MNAEQADEAKKLYGSLPLTHYCMDDADDSRQKIAKALEAAENRGYIAGLKKAKLVAATSFTARHADAYAAYAIQHGPPAPGPITVITDAIEAEIRAAEDPGRDPECGGL